MGLGERLLAAYVAFFSLFFGGWILFKDEVIFGGRRGNWLRSPTPDVHLHGWPVYWYFLVSANIAVIALTFIIDHYDRQDNAAFYVKFRKGLMILTLGLLLIGIVSSFREIWRH